jgi:hypothetical protein
VKNTQQINRLTASTKTERNLFSRKVRQKQSGRIGCEMWQKVAAAAEASALLLLLQI